MPINTRKLFSESLTIILSVLFALFINEWRNSYNENKRTQVILENIKQEMQENQALTKQLFDYHSTVRHTIKNALDQDSLEASFFSDGVFDLSKAAPNGIIQKHYKNIAWEVAKEARITNRINFKLSTSLFDVYTQQQIVHTTIYRIGSFFSDRRIHQKALLHENMVALNAEFNLLVGQQQYLLDKFEIAIKQLHMKNSN